jgi:hypothetical protein
MGRRKAWALAWLLAAILSALLLQVPSAQGGELLVNGGFENGIAPWMARGGELNATAGLGINQSSAAVFSTDDSHDYHWVGQCVSARGEVDYQFSGWIARPDQGQQPSAYLRISWYGDAGCLGEELTFPDDSVPVPLTLGGNWYPLTLEGRRGPPPARSARVRIVLVGSAATVYLDDFSFAGPPAPTPSPSPTASPSPAASPSPWPEPMTSPTRSPMPSPSPTAVSTPTQVPFAATPSQSNPTPSARLANAGFEEADDEGRPLAWQKYGGELRRSSVARWEGQFSAAFTSRTVSTKWAFQTVAVEAGKAYVLSGYALKNDANVQSAYLRLSWYASRDGSGRAIDSVDSSERLADDSPDFRFLSSEVVVAPAEAASAKVRLMLDPVSEREGRVYFDAISFEETSMPPPTQTAVPSPFPGETAAPPGATQTPLSPPPSGDRESPTPAAAAPPAPAEEPEPPSSPTVSRPSSTVLDASSAGPEATASPTEARPQAASPVAGRGTATPVFLYRERRTAQSIQAGGVAAGVDEDDGLSPIVLVPAIAALAAAAGATAFFVWRRWGRRARPP